MHAGIVGMTPRAPFRLDVAAAATQFALPAGYKKSTTYVIKAICPGSTVYIGADNTVTTSNGYPLNDGETITIEARDFSHFWHIGGASDELSVFPFDRV